MFLRNFRFSHCLPHEVQPAITFSKPDGEWKMARTKTGVTALFDIDGGSTEAINNEVSEPFLCALPIAIGVHLSNQIIHLHAMIEGSDHLTKAGFSDLRKK